MERIDLLHELSIIKNNLVDIAKAYEDLKSNYDYLKLKYDDILATESGYESKTENVWQSGYASGHEAACEKVNALQAKCERYDELYRLCFSNFAKLRARCLNNERMVSMGDNIRAIIEDVTNKMLAMPQPDNTGHEPFLVQSASEALSGEGEKEVELSCMVCGEKFMGPEPKMCCSGGDCGCMGLPIDPIVCSKECYNHLTGNQNEDKQ